MIRCNYCFSFIIYFHSPKRSNLFCNLQIASDSLGESFNVLFKKSNFLVYIFACTCCKKMSKKKCVLSSLQSFYVNLCCLTVQLITFFVKVIAKTSAFTSIRFEWQTCSFLNCLMVQNPWRMILNTVSFDSVLSKWYISLTRSTINHTYLTVLFVIQIELPLCLLWELQKAYVGFN